MEEKKQEQPQHEAPKTKSKSDSGGVLVQFEAFLEEYLVKKAPFAIPAGGREFIVQISPYLIIIFAVLSVPIILAGLGISAFLTPIAMLGGYNPMHALISMIFAVVTLVMELSAVPGLFGRARKGWRLVFYASIVSLIGSVATGNIVGALIGALIGWYILFQVRSLYTK